MIAVDACWNGTFWQPGAHELQPMEDEHDLLSSKYLAYRAILIQMSARVILKYRDIRTEQMHPASQLSLG